ncbi:MAG: LamG domain-containing protein [Flavobacteriales bacterium]|nr:LamG domain-containing protein [Flavobacteriales bacterium]
MIINNSAGPLQIDSIKVSGNTFSTTNTSAQIPAGDTIIQMVSFNAQNSDTATVRVYSAASVNPFSFKIKGSVLHAGLHFDGINDFVEILDNNTLDFINGFTIESWVKPDVLKTSAIISKFGNGSSNRSWALLLLSDGTVELSLSHNGASEVFFGSNAKLNVGQWNHVAYRYDGSTMNVFINGVKDINDQTTSGSVFNSTMPILIGARDNGSIQLFFEGAIDETRLWNFARPDNEIVSSANCELLGVESGLVAYYSYNEGSPNGNNSGLAHLKDRSNNSNNGDFVNLSLTNSPISNFVEGAITEVSGKCTDTLTIAIGIDSQATCFGGLGGATVTASDGFPSYSYLWSNGITSQSIIAMSGTYSVTVTDGSGDTESASIVISQPSEIRTNLTDTVCDQYFWQSTGLTYTSTGIYYDTLVSYAGCDSILQLDLTINQSFVSVDTVVACDIYTWQQNGSTYNSSGMYYDSLTTTSGCDSILALMLTINDSHLHIDTVVTCDDFYLWSQNALIYYVSGMYYDSLKTIDGCDSVIALSLTIDNHFHMDTVVACDDYTWQQNGNTYASSGVYYDSLLSVNGCDSVIALSLTINKYLDVDTIEACRNFTWQQNNSAYNASGIYYDSLSTINGCDSVFKLVLNIDTIDTILNVSGLTLSTNQTGSYQWLDCNGFTVINGETSSSFAVPANGSYALEIMNGACVDTTTCVNVISVGAVDINSNSGLQVYPNPTSGKINIAFQKGRQLTLLDQMGREVMRVQMTSDYMTIDLEHLSTGLYFLTSRSDRIKIMLE